MPIRKLWPTAVFMVFGWCAAERTRADSIAKYTRVLCWDVVQAQARRRHVTHFTTAFVR